jgi:transcriptional regulator with XRE-family HTH domain
MQHPINVSIGLKLKQRRRQQLMTQKELAEKIGVSAQQVQKYEKGVDNINQPKLAICMKTLNVDANYFFDEILK